MSVISMKQLLEAGVHFGHQTRRWNPKMAPYIYTERNGIHIIDLQKSVGMVDSAYEALKNIVANGGTVLFVGTKKQAQDADALQQRLGAEYQNEVAKYNKALSDSVHNYLKEYNKDKKYSLILAKSGDNILYADPAYNITEEVVKGMNQAYKGMKK